MENNRQNCYEIAKRIYKLDKDVYECLGSSLGRTFTGDEARKNQSSQTIDG